MPVMDLDLIEHNDNFREFTENDVYYARCAGFIIRNIGNTVVWLNHVWPLYPNQEYSLQSLVIHTIVNKNYFIQFKTPQELLTAGTPIVNHVVIAEEYYGHIEEYSNYAPLK